jgi:serine phosphatase RsbU (regulator of sigma subunit)
MIGHRLLTEVIIERKIYQPSQVLELMNTNLQKELSQDNKRSMDGMDIGLCRFGIKNGQYDELLFSGAKRPLLIYSKEEGKLSLIDADRKGIGGSISGEHKTFTDKEVKIHKGDMVFLYTDGLIDQQNNERKRFGTNRFTAIISENSNESMANIKFALEKAFDEYSEPEEQRDDVTMIGLRI